MNRVVAGVVLIVLGLVAIVFSGPFARYNIWGQNTLWGTRLGSRATNANRASLIAFGLAFIGIGTLVLLR